MNGREAPDGIDFGRNVIRRESLTPQACGHTTFPYTAEGETPCYECLHRRDDAFLSIFGEPLEGEAA